VHSNPPIYTIDNFLTDNDCAALIETAGPLLQRSKTHAAAGSEATKGRTSLTCHLAKKAFPCPIMLQKIQVCGQMRVCGYVICVWMCCP
jgi:prolyl 4-hydroxylase